MKRTAMIFALAALAMVSRADAAQDSLKLDELAADLVEVRAHAEEWAVGLRQDPSYTGYVIAFEARTGRPGAAAAAAHNAVAYMMIHQGIDPSRLHEATGPRRPTATVEFWMVPAGGKPPVPK